MAEDADPGGVIKHGATPADFVTTGWLNGRGYRRLTI